MSKLLGNAIVFKATLPNAELLSEHLQEIPHSEISEHAMQHCGFSVNEATGEWVTPVDGGFAIQLKVSSKVMPADVIKAEYDSRVKSAIAENNGYPINKKEKQCIKSEVIAMLLPDAFVRTKTITAVYHQDSKLLIVDAARKAIADIFIPMLVKCCGSVKTETINISDVKLGVTTKLKNYLQGEDSFNGFGVGEYCKVVNQLTGEKKTYDGSDFQSNPDSVINDFDCGFQVKDIQLSRNDLKFKLTSDFHFKQFKFEKIDSEEFEDDYAYAWRHEASVKMIQIIDIVESMVELVEYKN